MGTWCSALPERRKPVYYALRSLTPTEQKYPQVEKEALVVTWDLKDSLITS